MKKTILIGVFCVNAISQAEFRILMPLEINNNGSLPDNSIIFKNINEEITPETPATPEEATDCKFDINSGTYYAIYEAAGESVVEKMLNAQKISNGSRGKFIDGSRETYGAPVYELCMNGEEPQLYVEPAETWANGECKYNTLGEAAPRFWVEINNANIQGEKAFHSANAGVSGYISYHDTNATFLNFGTLYGYGIKINNNSQIIYNGYKYYKGKYIYSLENGYSYTDNYNGIVFSSPMDYYEICRTQ